MDSKNGKTQLFNSGGVVKLAKKKVEYPFKHSESDFSNIIMCTNMPAISYSNIVIIKTL